MLSRTIIRHLRRRLDFSQVIILEVRPGSCCTCSKTVTSQGLLTYQLRQLYPARPGVGEVLVLELQHEWHDGGSHLSPLSHNTHLTADRAGLAGITVNLTEIFVKLLLGIENIYYRSKGEEYRGDQPYQSPSKPTLRRPLRLGRRLGERSAGQEISSLHSCPCQHPVHCTRTSPPRDCHSLDFCS